MSQRVYLQDVMKQGNAALVGLGLCELEQRAELEPLCVPCVTSLEEDGRLKIQTSSNVSLSKIYTRQRSFLHS